MTKIIGTGSSLPKHVVSNEFLSTIVDTSDEWIQTRTGIANRRLAKEETTVSMGAEAGRKAIENAGMKAEDIDMILLTTMSPDNLLPASSCEIQRILGAKRAVTMDINAACSGFVFALNTAHAYLKAGLYKNILIIGSEVLSKMIDWKDRRTCVLFGDGAGAAVVTSAEKGLFEMEMYSDGDKSFALTCPNRSIINPLIDCDAHIGYIQMDGQEVFKFAARKVPESIGQVLQKAQIEKAQIKYYILHQANKRILESVAKRLGEPMDKFPINLQNYGNTSAASIPILLDEMNQANMLHPGDKIVLAGFGGGLTWGATVMEW